jgi:hypothetical protein
VAEPEAGPEDSLPIARALGQDFNGLHAAVKVHYGAPTVDFTGAMDAIHLKGIIAPLARVSYMLLGFPVPHSGRAVEFKVSNRVDDLGAMRWVRNFIENSSFPAGITFASRMVWSGDHRIIEYARYGVGAEAVVSVDGEGSLVYDMRSYVVRIPVLGAIVRFPTWLSPFGRGSTKEIGETPESFRVEFEMTHPLFGRTLAYAGRCKIESTG